MQSRLSPSQPVLRLQLRRGRFLFAFVLVAAFMAVAHTLFSFQSDSIPAAGLLFLPLVLLGALSAGRELLTPSLKELAFYSSAIMAALLIWPTARLTVSAYEASGFVMLAAFMGGIFALAVALGMLAVKLLSRNDGEM